MAKFRPDSKRRDYFGGARGILSKSMTRVRTTVILLIRLMPASSRQMNDRPSIDYEGAD